MSWFLREGRRLLIVLPALALLLCLVGVYLTRGSMANLSFLHNPNAGLVDQRPWQTIQALAPLAVSAEEQSFAQEAERLADHEVDQAFAQALREANTQSKAMSPEAQTLAQKVASLQQQVKTDQTRVDALTPPKGSNGAAANVPDNDDLDVAKTQLQLDSDELDDAQETLVETTGDKRGVIQQELAARQATLKKTAAAGDGKTAVVSAKSHGTLAGRIGSWFGQRSRHALLLEAKREADSDAATLSAQHAAVEKKMSEAAAAASASLAAPAPSNEGTAQGAKPMTRAARLQLLHALSEEHAILDDRIATQQQLSQVYAKWLAQVERQHEIVFHLMLGSFAWIAFIVLCTAIAISIARALVDRWTSDQRRVHTLRTISSLAIQVVSLILVLLVIVGPPSQVPTILGLATAGITVVFQDFILAFFGWFILMGKHGIRVGDRVEINSVAGEVTEIGLFRTTLVETGNWNDKGHPTGRKVVFINNFAINGQFFNFSTAGQWMWDELIIGVPSVEATYANIHAIREKVIADAGVESELAIAEWRASTGQRSLAQINASPSVDLRPSALGIDVIVRYITRATHRYEMRNRIYQAIIDILHPQP